MGVLRADRILCDFSHSAVLFNFTFGRCYLVVLNYTVLGEKSHVNQRDVLVIFISLTDLPIRNELVCFTEI